MTPADRELLEDWRWVARRANVAHLRATDTFGSRYVRIGGAAVVLAAITSSTVFATLDDGNEGWRLAAAIVGLLSAALAGLNTFLRYGERVEMHRRAARQYGNIVRRIHELLVCSPDSGLCTVIEQLRAEMDAIDNDAPNVPGYVWIWAVDGVALEQTGELDDASSHRRGFFDWLRRREGHRAPQVRTDSREPPASATG
jgi:hypothetical protein